MAFTDDEKKKIDAWLLRRVHECAGCGARRPLPAGAGIQLTQPAPPLRHMAYENPITFLAVSRDGSPVGSPPHAICVWCENCGHMTFMNASTVFDDRPG